MNSIGHTLKMFFVVFEGLDGSGKSSLMKRLCEHLQKMNQPVVMTREPGGTLLGDEIRDIVLKQQSEPPTDRAELLLYQASRAQHVAKVIKPALAEKKWVLCDRFSASSVAFQGGGRGLSTEHVEWLNRFSTQDLSANLTVLLDLSVEESKKRRTGRSSTTGLSEDRIEAEAETFHEKVRQSFLTQSKQNQKDWLVLDASKTPDELFQTLMNHLRGLKWLS